MRTRGLVLFTNFWELNFEQNSKGNPQKRDSKIEGGGQIHQYNQDYNISEGETS